jgi:cupin fold WbuC family metalloprotein
MGTFRLALDPPSGALTILDGQSVVDAIDAARNSPRGRIIAPFHKTDADPLHRMLNAVEPHSYIRPHRHLDPPKAEAWLVLRGSVAFFTFEDDGRVRDALTLAAGSDAFGVDLAPGVYHSFIALSTGTVLYEVKPGPYRASDDKSFAPFAPAEGSAEAPAYMASLLAVFRERHAR